jgi:DinB superfamily
MEQAERDRMCRQLSQSRELLRQAVSDLSAEQRTFRPAADRWSVADCIEHLTVVENFTVKRIQQLLEQPPAGPPDTNGKDQLIMDHVPVRARRVKGPEAVMPSGRWADFDELLHHFEAARHNTIGFAEATEADLRAYAFPHPFLGPLDCYQWLLFLATHCERHVRQMEEVKSDPAFPGKVGSAIA